MNDDSSFDSSLNESFNSDAQKLSYKKYLIVQRDKNVMISDINFRSFAFDIVPTVQFTYIFPYFLLTIGLYALVYAFSSQVIKYWSSKYECDNNFIRWFISFLVFAPFATILASTLTRRLQESYGNYIKNYTFYDRKIRVKLVNTKEKKYFVAIIMIDLFHFIWAIVGLAFSTQYNANDCKYDFTYMAFTGAFLIGMGLVFFLRMAYMLVVFVFGRKILDHYESQERLKNTVDVKFKTFQYTNSLYNQKKRGSSKDKIYCSLQVEEVQDELYQHEEEENVCSICFCEYYEGEEVAKLPCNDKHIFHSACIAQWLTKNDLCPLCKANIIRMAFKKQQ